ncbi:MAG: diheme cytochrome c [Polaromonas sp.]|nr:diheme cytochrome c [Polaromonas sp.]
MVHSNFKPLTLTLTLTLLAAGAAAHAGGAGARVPPLPSYQQECAACHIAYPPGMLPAASWQRMMGSLNKHYGTDASLDEASVRAISGWLKAHAGTYKRVNEAPPQDRITTSAWFVRKHRKVDAQVWKHASVKSAANCAACHTRADRGDYDENNITFPAGLDARYRRGWSD